MNIISWLRTPTATLIVLCSALLAQLPHAADVFRLVVVGEGLWPTLHSYTYAIALELAVLLFVVQRRNVESYLFAGVSILVNLSYYHLHGVALWTVEAAPAWLISIALPAAIAQYSHLIADATDEHAAQDAAQHASPAQTDAGEAQEVAESSPFAPQPAQLAPQPAQALAPSQRRAHIREQELFDAAQVVAQFGVSLRTAQQDIAQVRKATTHANGAARHE